MFWLFYDASNVTILQTQRQRTSFVAQSFDISVRHAQNLRRPGSAGRRWDYPAARAHNQSLSLDPSLVFPCIPSCIPSLFALCVAALVLSDASERPNRSAASRSGPEGCLDALIQSSPTARPHSLQIDLRRYRSASGSCGADVLGDLRVIFGRRRLYKLRLTTDRRLHSSRRPCP